MRRYNHPEGQKKERQLRTPGDEEECCGQQYQRWHLNLRETKIEHSICT